MNADTSSRRSLLAAMPWICAALLCFAPCCLGAPTGAQGKETRSVQTLESPDTHDWREVFTPFQDPLRTRPAELDHSLNLELPPDLHAGNGAAEAGIDAFPCADDDSARAFDDPERARFMLAGGETGAPGKKDITDKLASPDLPRLDLPQAVRLALCHNAEVRGAWSAIAQQAAVLGQARSAYLPQINAGANRYRSRLRYPGSRYPDSDLRVSSQNIGLSWRLFDFGLRNARTEAAGYQLQAALASRDAAVYKALRDVAQTYFDAQIAWARLQAQQELQPLAERTLQATRRRQAQGAGSGNDTLQAESALARIKLERSRAEGDYRKVLALLTQTLGLPAHAGYRLAPLAILPESSSGTPNPHLPMQKALDDWLTEAAERHPAILSARAQWQAARASVRAARAEGMPTLDLGYNYYRNGRPNTSLNTMQSRESVLSISLSFPLFDGFNTTYKVRGAQALAEQKGIEYEAARQQILREIAQTHAEAHAALDNLDAARRLYRAAQATAQSTQRQYEGGAADILRVNQSLDALQQSLLERTRAEAEWLAARMKLWSIETAIETSQPITEDP